MSDAFQKGVAAFRSGNPVLAYDAADRESEIDIVYPAAAIDPQAVATMRNDAGGLVCVAVSDRVGSALELPFAGELLDHPVAGGTPAYGDRSATTISVNHRETYTGITDIDRARTISALSELAADPSLEGFTERFRSPGHVRLLRATPNLLEQRRGHTEFAVKLAVAAGRPPVAAICEMLDDSSGAALSPEDAQAYADRHGLPYVDIDELTGDSPKRTD